jgi:hypothetical protein
MALTDGALNNAAAQPFLHGRLLLAALGFHRGQYAADDWS